MGLALILFAGAVVILIWLYLWSLQRQRLGHIPELENQIADIPAAAMVANGDAVIVATEHGQVIHVNETIRHWLNVENPDLEMIARSAQPVDTFLELFTREAQASLQIGSRWVEATSHRLPAEGGQRMVVVLRELTANTTNPDALDLNRAINVVNEIGETINASQGLEPVLQGLLTIVRKELPADAGEVCLWDEEQQVLVPRGWIGDSAYVLALVEAGGAYALGEGISGWIAQYRRPVLSNVNDETAVRPKLSDGRFQSYIGVPLLVGDRFVGTLEFAAVRQFSPGDLSLLQAVAKPVTTAIYNAELYTGQMRRIEDLATLQQVIDQTALADDPAKVILTLNQRIARLLDARVSGMLVYDDLREALVALPPFYGLPLQIVRNFAIPVPEGSPAHDIWQQQDYWMTSDIIGEPLADDMRLSLLVNTAGMHELILMPLQVGSRRIGAILIGDKQAGGGFNAQDIQNLRLLSAQAAVAVEDIRLVERQQIHETEMTGLQEIAQAFGAISHSDVFYANVTERIARVMGIERCGILLYDEESDCLIAQKPYYGLDNRLVARYVVPLRTSSALNQIWREEDYWYTNAVSTDKVIYGAGLAELVGEMGLHTTLLAVMSTGGRRLGVVQVSNKISGEDFTDNDARLLLIFSAQIAGMIENARLLRAVQARADESEGLRRVAEYAGGVMTGEDDFLPVLREICRLTNSPAAFVNVLDPQSGRLIGYPKYGYGFQRAEPVIYDTYEKGFERSVALSRQPFISYDVPLDDAVLPAYRATFHDMDMTTTVIVPLLVGEQVLGEMGVFNREDPPYAEADVRNLQAIAIHVAAALDRVRLQEATGQNLRRRLQELDAISHVSNELATTLDYERVLDVIRYEAVRATDAEGNSVVLLRHPEKLDDAPRVDRRLGESQSKVLTSVELLAIQQGIEPVVVEDYQAQTALQADPPAARSAVAAAIIYEDHPIGVIHLYHSQPYAFDDRAATFLMTLAAKASLSYGNNRRYVENQERSDHLRRRVEQLSQIFELGQMLQTNVDPGSVLEAIAFSIQQSIGFDIVVMLMVDEDAGVLRRFAQAGLPIEAFEESKYKSLPMTLLRELLDNDEFRVNESHFLPAERMTEWYRDGFDVLGTDFAITRTMHPRSEEDWHDGDLLLVPLMGAGGNLLGMMSLDRPFGGRRPDRSTIEILEIFAHQTSTTLENTRLYTTSVRNVEQEAQLNEVMEAIASTLDPGEIVELVAHGALRLLPFMRMTFALLEPEQQSFDLTSVTVKADNSLQIERELRPSLEGGALEFTFETGEDALYSADEGATYPDLQRWHSLGERTSLVVPLITGGICLGALHLGSDLAHAFGFEEFRPLIKRIGNLAAVAMQNARLFNQAVNLRAFNELVVELIQQGIVVLDNVGRVITVNDFMRRRLGWSEAARQDLFEFRPALRPILAQALQAVVTDAAPQELINQIVIEDDQRLVQSFYLYPLRAAEGVRGVVLLIEDVTERTRLEQDIAARANQLAALTEISSRITAALDRDEVLTLTLDEMQRVISYDVMTLWRHDGDDLVIEGARGFTPGDPPFRIAITAHPRLAQVLEARRAVSINHFKGTDALPGEDEIGSWLAAPLIRQRDVIGMITLGKREENFYDQQAQQAASAFANQVAVAMVNADLFEEARARTERLSLLNRVSVALAQSLDVENIMEIALSEIAQSLQIERSRATIFERETNAARVVVEHPRGDSPPTEFSDLRENAVFQQVMHSAAPLVIENAALYDGDPAIATLLQKRELTAYLVMPLTVGGQVSGVFELEAADTPRHFDPEKFDLATIIANQAAIAVLNANLLEQTLVRTRELETLLEAAQATSYTLDLDEVFASIVRLVLQALDMDDCAIMLYDNVEEELRVELELNRDDDAARVTPTGTLYDLREYPAKSHALHDGKIIVLRYDDPNADRREIETMVERGVSARMLAPLIVRDQSIGLLQIELRTQMRTFTYRDTRMAQALGAQAATAIENARLSTQTAALVEQSLVINDISRTISATMNTQDMINIVRDHMPTLTDAEEIIVALYNEERDEISFPLAIRAGGDFEMPPCPLGSDEFSFVIRYRRPVSMGGENPSAAEVRRNLGIVTDVDSSRFLGVPLMAGDQVAGVLAVRDTKQTRPFGLNDNRILTTIAAQLGATLQNAQLFERVQNFANELNVRVEERTLELQEERDRVNTLYQITAELGRTLDTDRVLARALQMVAKAIGANDGVVMLLDAQTGVLYCRTALNTALGEPVYGTGDGPGRISHPAEQLARWMIENESAIRIDDLDEKEFWTDAAWHSALGVIIETNEDVQGVMVLLGREPAQFTDPHLQLVIAATAQVAAAVNNADLYNLIRDQNERMAALLRAEQEEAGKNSAILEGIADGVLLADATGVVVLFNRAAEQILGVTRDSALGLPLARIARIHEDAAQWVNALDAWVAKPTHDGRAGEDELTIDRLEVGRRVVSVHASQVSIGDQFLGTVSVFRDVTRDVEVDRMKSEFIFNVSHELRTPMTSIKGYADLLLSGGVGSVSGEQQQLLGTIKGNTDRLATLVNDLLDVSRIDSGRDHLDVESVQIGVVIRQVVDNLQARPQFSRKALSLQIDVDPELPAIQADPLKIIQVVSHLIDNAFNYTNAGGNIEIRAHRRTDAPENVLITVKDDGIGIPEEFQSRIWDRFARYEAHALVMDVAGTGLGLSIVKSLVEMHRGEVWFESQEDAGTTFYVSLPVAGPEGIQLTSEQTVEG